MTEEQLSLPIFDEPYILVRLGEVHAPGDIDINIESAGFKSEEDVLGFLKMLAENEEN